MIKNQHDNAFLNFVNKLETQENAYKALAQLRQQSELQFSLLLFCCWFAQTGQGRLTKVELQDLRILSLVWHDNIVRTLQKFKQKIQVTRFNEEIKNYVTTSLQYAENSELLMLTDTPLKYVRTTRTPQQRLMDACKNIALYCKMQEIAIDASLIETFYQLLACIFPAVDLMDTHQTCRKIFCEENEGIVLQKKLLFE